MHWIRTSIWGDSTTPRSRRRIAAAALVAVLALTVMQSLSAALGEMHLPGRASGTVTDIASISGDANHNEALIRSWVDWDVAHTHAGPKTAAPAWVIAVWLAIDSLVFAPALAIVLAWLAHRREKLLASTSWLLPLLGVGGVAALAYLLSDELENLTTAVAVFQSVAWVRVVVWMTRLKLLFLAVAILPIVLSVIPRVAGERNRAYPPLPVVPTIRALRVPLTCAVLAALVLTQLPSNVRPQLYDVIRSWVPGDRPAAAPLAAAALILVTIALWAAVAAVTKRSRTDAKPAGDGTISVRRLVTYLITAAAVLLLSRLTWPWVGPVLVATIAVFVIAFALLSLSKTARHAASTRTAVDVNDGVRRAVVATPAIATLLMVLSAIDYVGPARDVAWLGLVAVVAAAIAVGAWHLPSYEPSLRFAGGTLIAIGGASVVLAGLGWKRPLGIGWALGSVAILLFGVAAVLGVLSLSEHLLWRPPRGALARIYVQRVPILLSVVVLFWTTSYFDKSVALHDARTIPARAGAASSFNAPTFDGQQLIRSYQAQAPALATPKAPVLPVFVIAASGGGGRAQYWTLDVMNCLFAGVLPDGANGLYPGCGGNAPWDRVMFASGISGGSVGLAMFAAPNDDPVREAVDIRSLFARGFLDPVIASTMFKEVPNSLLRVDGDDRAAVLEKAFEDRLPAMGDAFFARQLGPPPQTPEAGSAATALPGTPRFPTLLLNSAAVDDGCRINVSTMKLSHPLTRITRDHEPVAVSDPSRPVTAEDRSEPLDASCRTVLNAESGPLGNDQPMSGTKDVADYLCAGFRQDEHDATDPLEPNDLRLSTAALLSARFPFVSPTGALTSCDRIRGDKVHTFAVDGGYVDATAASPLVEILNALIRDNDANPDVTAPPDPNAPQRPCIQPVVLQVDNSYEQLDQPSGPERQAELLAPLHGQSVASSGHSGASFQALAQLAAVPRCDLGALTGVPTYLHVYPESHPGSQAPLGWSLSLTAQKDLDAQLGRTPNQCALLAARAWLARSTQGLKSCARVLPEVPGQPNAASNPPPFATYTVCRAAASCENAPPARNRCDVSADAVCVATADGAGAVRVVLDDDSGWRATTVSLGAVDAINFQQEVDASQATVALAVIPEGIAIAVIALIAYKNRRSLWNSIRDVGLEDPSQPA